MSFQHYPEFHGKILQDKKLSIPKKYVKKYWKGISNPIFLRFPNGVQQEIFWVERNGDILFQKNWTSFAKSLKCGYLLSFKYIGGSYFKVKIFGVNALEINYSNVKSVSEEVIEVSDESEDESEAESEDECEAESDDECEISKQPQRTRSVKRKFNMDLDSAQQKFTGVNNKNPSFDLKLTPTYAHGYFFRIPVEFSRKYMKGFDGIAMLKVGDHEDRTWEVIVIYDSVQDSSIVKSGWNIFTRENNLQIDDVCKFKMTRSEPLSFTVTIIRARDGPNRKKLQGSEGSNVMKHKTFKIVVKSTYPYVPNDVLSSCGECDRKLAELKVDGKSWSVKLNCQKGNSNKLHKGWAKFKKDCQLEIGDTCFFELIDEKKPVFKVSIRRKN